MLCFGVCQTHPPLMFSQGNFKTNFEYYFVGIDFDSNDKAEFW
jgi:hypothetical protein